MKKILKIAGILVLVLIMFALGAVAYVKTALPDVGEAPQLNIEKTPARLERGEYLANHITVCMDCHSTRDWTLYGGPLKEGNLGGGGEAFNKDMGFPGNFYARNITPYALGNWTDGEIFRAITTGVSKNGNPLFPVMPYHGYGQLDTEDIYSLITYVRSLKPIKNDVPASEADFPVNILLNTMPAKANPGKRPDETDILNHGKYLVLAANCVECHSQTEKGAKIPGTEFSGGMEFKFPSGTVRSSNITSDNKTGIGLWSEDAFVKRFKLDNDSGYVPHKVGPKDMNTPMPWGMYKGMDEKDLRAIYTYLKTIKPIEHQVVKFTPN